MTESSTRNWEQGARKVVHKGEILERESNRNWKKIERYLEEWKTHKDERMKLDLKGENRGSSYSVGIGLFSLQVINTPGISIGTILESCRRLSFKA